MEGIFRIMDTLKSFGAMIIISILQNLLKFRGKKIIPIKWNDEPAIDIPIEWR